jgi:hypothetical protein
MAARVRGLLVLFGVAATLLAGVITGPAADAQSATCTTPTATLTVNPTTVAAGGTLQVSASNYTPSVPITFYDNGQQVGTNNGTNAQGSVSGPYTVPATAASGQHTLVGSQPSGKCASTTFTVTGGSGTGTGTSASSCNGQATLTLSTTTPTPGQSITATGSGFNGNETVVVADNGNFVSQVTATNGTMSTALTAQSGGHLITATGQSGRCGRADYTTPGYAGGTAGTGVCPTGYYFDGTQCVAGAYPGTYPGTYSGAYPGPYGGQGRCPLGYVDIGYACQPGPYAGSYCPPGGTYPPGSSCAATQGAYGTTPYATTATTVVQSAPQTVASGRVAYTGSRTIHTAAYGLALLIGGLMLLSARAVIAPFRR